MQLEVSSPPTILDHLGFQSETMVNLYVWILFCLESEIRRQGLKGLKVKIFLLTYLICFVT